MVSKRILPPVLKKAKLYFVGIKGTGMSALAELMQRHGAKVSGSDTDERFYTDAILTSLGIPYYEGFHGEQVPDDADLVVYSAAYDPDVHPEILEARRRNIPIAEYTLALGELSRNLHATGIAGVHGKTTTAAMAGTIVKELELPAGVLVGSAVRGFDDRATYFGGDRYFIAETCEYRRHFLSFHPNQLVITTVDVDHLDYYRDYADIESAFLEYADRLPKGGILIYCADDAGARGCALKLAERRPDLVLRPYGFEATGDFQIVDYRSKPGVHTYRLAGWQTEFKLMVPGVHSVLDAAAAAAAVYGILVESGGQLDQAAKVGEHEMAGVAAALETFRGSKRRSEILGERRGVLFADDYGHHPNEIKTTLAGFRRFYPGRRMIVDFMSHTYTRTQALLDEFAVAFADADIVILHKIYASAREKAGCVDGRTLFEKVKQRHPHVLYYHEVDDAEADVMDLLQTGDLFITLGAGDNWRLGAELYEKIESEKKR
ncbi:MAG: UDP-N-acetylmuramate--L-alanine ligase [Spirochaetota bacterium]